MTTFFIHVFHEIHCCLWFCASSPHLAWQTWEKTFCINVQVFQPFCIRDLSGRCIVALLCPDMWGATGRMKYVMACVALDEAIGKTRQGYHEWVCVGVWVCVLCVGVCVDALECSACVDFEKCARWLPVGFLCHLTAEQRSPGRRSLVTHCV